MANGVTKMSKTDDKSKKKKTRYTGQGGGNKNTKGKYKPTGKEGGKQGVKKAGFLGPLNPFVLLVTLP